LTLPLNESYHQFAAMFDRDGWQEIFATLKSNKWRTFLTCFGVFWGIFMLMIMLGSGDGLRKGILSDFGGTATNSFFCWAQKTSKPFQGLKPGRGFNFNNEDIKALQAIPELSVVAPMNQLGDYKGSNMVVRGLKSGSFQITGIYPELASIQSIKVDKGRFLNELDLREKRKVAIIGKRVLEVLFAKDENPLGKYIRINGVYFMVAGITATGGSGQNIEEQLNSIYLPFSTFQQAFNYGNVVGWFAITSRPGIGAEEAEEKALAVLKRRHRIAPDDLTAIGHWNMEKEFNKLNGLFTGIEWLVWVVGTGTLLAGVIGVSNIMLIVVRERTREIGIKRALGATPAQIMRQIITESVFITMLAGYSGLVTGVGLMELVAGTMASEEGGMFRNPEVNLNTALTALGILVVAGLFAGLIPARRAVAVEPVEALRTE
jgi:putative ABC transport system permease protein